MNTRQEEEWGNTPVNFGRLKFGFPINPKFVNNYMQNVPYDVKPQFLTNIENKMNDLGFSNKSIYVSDEAKGIWTKEIDGFAFARHPDFKNFVNDFRWLVGDMAYDLTQFPIDKKIAMTINPNVSNELSEILKNSQFNLDENMSEEETIREIEKVNREFKDKNRRYGFSYKPITLDQWHEFLEIKDTAMTTQIIEYMNTTTPEEYEEMNKKIHDAWVQKWYNEQAWDFDDEERKKLVNPYMTLEELNELEGNPLEGTLDSAKDEFKRAFKESLDRAIEQSMHTKIGIEARMNDINECRDVFNDVKKETIESIKDGGTIGWFITTSEVYDRAVKACDEKINSTLNKQSLHLCNVFAKNMRDTYVAWSPSYSDYINALDSM